MKMFLEHKGQIIFNFHDPLRQPILVRDARGVLFIDDSQSVSDKHLWYTLSFIHIPVVLWSANIPSSIIDQQKIKRHNIVFSSRDMCQQATFIYPADIVLYSPCTPGLDPRSFQNFISLYNNFNYKHNEKHHHHRPT